MKKTLSQLEAENEKLKDALREITLQMENIQKTLDSVSDFLDKRKEGPVTNEDVKKLLEKYSTL